MNLPIVVLVTSLLLSTLDASEQYKAPLPTAPAAAEKVVARIYNKTLGSLGIISSIHLSELPSDGPSSGGPSAHAEVWEIIERSRLQNVQSVGVALGLPPRFRIEYSNGLTVSVAKYHATVTFPDGTHANYVLLP